MYTGVHPILRRLHTWIGILILLPIILISITAILLAHDKELGLKDIRLDSSWLPAAWTGQHQTPEIKAYLPGENGSAVIGTKSGAYLLEDHALTPIPELAGIDIRALTLWHGGILAATKQGAFLGIHGQWKRVYQGDTHSFAADEEGSLFIAAHHKGMKISRDGGASWQTVESITQQIANIDAETPVHDMELKKLIKGLHSGRLLVGKRDEWLWIDVISGLLLFASLIGVFRWWKKRNLY